MRRCEHTRRYPWDCGCSFGCDQCALNSECARCGRFLKSQPNAQKRVRHVAKEQDVKKTKWRKTGGRMYSRAYGEECSKRECDDAARAFAQSILSSLGGGES